MALRRAADLTRGLGLVHQIFKHRPAGTVLTTHTARQQPRARGAYRFDARMWTIIPYGHKNLCLVPCSGPLPSGRRTRGFLLQ